jgi:hypothetical protein
MHGVGRVERSRGSIARPRVKIEFLADAEVGGYLVLQTQGRVTTRGRGQTQSRVTRG